MLNLFKKPVPRQVVETKASIQEAFPAETWLQIFSGYSVDELKIVIDAQKPEQSPSPNFVTDFIGVKTRVTTLAPAHRHLANTVLPVPIPADYHAETIEWLGLLRSAREAKGKYRVLELGAGFGVWSVAGGVAARNLGFTDIQIYAVEGDPLLCSLAKQHYIDNVFANGQIIEGAVGEASGTATWPRHSGNIDNFSYDARPILEGDKDYLGRTSNMVEVRVFALNDLLDREPTWDLIHIDIQGHEVGVCRSAISKMTERVKRIIVGTHSRKIDGDLIELMWSNGWTLENEKPCRFEFKAGKPSMEAMTTMDGTQVWRNPKL